MHDKWASVNEELISPKTNRELCPLPKCQSPDRFWFLIMLLQYEISNLSRFLQSNYFMKRKCLISLKACISLPKIMHSFCLSSLLYQSNCRWNDCIYFPCQWRLLGWIKIEKHQHQLLGDLFALQRFVKVSFLYGKTLTDPNSICWQIIHINLRLVSISYTSQRIRLILLPLC